MKKLLLTVALCAATFWVIRAQSQRGTVMIQNSGKKWETEARKCGMIITVIVIILNRIICGEN